jgi:hypothetical protein
LSCKRNNSGPKVSCKISPPTLFAFVRRTNCRSEQILRVSPSPTVHSHWWLIGSEARAADFPGISSSSFYMRFTSSSSSDHRSSHGTDHMHGGVSRCHPRTSIRVSNRRTLSFLTPRRRRVIGSLQAWCRPTIVLRQRVHGTWVCQLITPAVCPGQLTGYAPATPESRTSEHDVRRD